MAGRIAVRGVAVLTPDGERVLWHDGRGNYWQDTSGNAGGPQGTPFVRLYGGDYGLIGTVSDGTLWQWNWPFRNMESDLAQRWFRIGGPGASFAVTAESVYGLTPDKRAVWRYDGTAMSWTQVGTGATEIFGGIWGLVATHPTTGALFHYLGSPFKWEQIGGPGASFVVIDSVYAISPDLSSVWRYDKTPLSWTQIGGPATKLYGGFYGLLADFPDGDLYRYLGNIDAWERTGAPTQNCLAVAQDGVYALAPNKSGVWYYYLDDHLFAHTWKPVYGPAESIVSAQHAFFS